MSFQGMAIISILWGAMGLWGETASAWDHFDEQYLQLLRVQDCGQVPCALRLKTTGGLWKRPTGSALRFVRAHQKQIRAIGREFGVHPTVISAVLIAEESTNMQLDDDLQNAVAWALGDHGEMSLMRIGDWFRKPISLGRSQANREGLIHAARVIRRVSPGRQVTWQDLARNLLNFKGDVEPDLLVIAALAREAQDDYRLCGLDISKNVGVLVTLHSLGRTRIRAQKARFECRRPSINFLGLFARKYIRVIHAATWR
jgi:hypothetical protein